MGTRVRWAVSVLGGVLAVVLLSGCMTLTPYPEIPRYAKSGGQTQAQLDATLKTISGITFTDASGGSPNVKGNTGYAFTLKVKPGYQVADAAKLVDFLVRSAWSVRDGWMPNTTIEISIEAGLAPATSIDLVAGAEQMGWVPVGSQAHGIGLNDGGSAPEFDPDHYTSVSVWVNSDEAVQRKSDPNGAVANRKSLGKWPGAVPMLATGIVVPRPTATP
jgi:hypothetical protein